MMEQFTGQTFDHYQIREPLGHGDMGTVHKALDTKLEQEVILKIIDASVAARPNFQERLVHFAQASAGLNDPTLVRVRDFGQAAPWFYLVTELVPGQNLLQFLNKLRQAKRWIPLPEAVHLTRQVCQALTQAHQHGLWPWVGHPRNILLQPDPSVTNIGPDLPYHPRLTDVGISKLQEAGSDPDREVTRLNLSFMSPEQVLKRPLDPRSDVYTVGALLYLLVNGELPLKAKNLGEAKQFFLNKGTLSAKIGRPDLPENLQAVIRQALAPNPDNRFNSVSALTAALTAFFRDDQDDTLDEVKADESAPVKISSLPLTTDQLVVRSPAGGVQTVPLQRSVLSLGRDPNNDVVLDHPDVSRHHARLEIDSAGYHITDLGSTNRVYLGDQLLAPNVAVAWHPGQILYIADFQLTIEPQPSPRVRRPREPTPLAIQLPPVLDPVGLLMPNNHLTVEPGQRVTTILIVQNQGRDSDLIKIEVEGVPADWVLAPSSQNLLPGKKQEVRLSLQPPRTAQSRAGRYDLLIRATSQKDPSQFVTVQGTLTVTEYEQFQSEIRPRQIEADRSAQVIIANHSNIPVTFDIHWLEGEDDLRFYPTQSQLTLPAGKNGAVEFQVGPARRRWWGARKLSPYSAQVVSARAGEVQTPMAEVESRGLIPTWGLLLIAIPLLALCAFLGVFYFIRPDGAAETAPLIRSLVIEPNNPQVGQPFIIRWQVDQAERVALRPLPIEVDANQGQYTFTAGLTQTTNLIFVASNRFGQTEQPFIIPISSSLPTSTPTATFTPVIPVVEEWSVFPTQITQGQAVTIRWRVSNAETVELQPLGQVQPSGERVESPQENQTYTLIVTHQGQTIEQSQAVIVSTPLPNAPRVTVFVAEPNVLITGQTNAVRLTWETEQADTVVIQPAVGMVSLKGFVDIPAPTADTIYTLTAKNVGGEAQAQIQVRVSTPTPTTTLTPTPTNTLTPSPTSTLTPTPSATHTLTPTPTASPTLILTPTLTQTLIPSPTITPTLAVTASATLTATVSP